MQLQTANVLRRSATCVTDNEVVAVSIASSLVQATSQVQGAMHVLK